ncbi:hypothetical protein FB451DRAFT_1418491 [Mycena latifolia]|nr:hypothetical protein FB451DRAFT_1418491 [Mycena latifolia]
MSLALNELIYGAPVTLFKAPRQVRDPSPTGATFPTATCTFSSSSTPLSRVALDRCDSSPFFNQPSNLRATRPLLFSPLHGNYGRYFGWSRASLSLSVASPIAYTLLLSWPRHLQVSCIRVILLWIPFLASPALPDLRTSKPKQTPLRLAAPRGCSLSIVSDALPAYITPDLAVLGRVEFAL